MTDGIDAVDDDGEHYSREYYTKYLQDASGEHELKVKDTDLAVYRAHCELAKP